MYQREDIKNRKDTLSIPGKTKKQEQHHSIARYQARVIVQARQITDSEIRTVNVQRGLEKAWYLRESVSKTKKKKKIAVRTDACQDRGGS